MDFSSLFNYPDSDKKVKSEELIFLGELDSEDWSKILAITEIIIFKESEIVIQKGDISRAIYIVKSGTLEIIVPKKNSSSYKRINLIEEGSVFGEIAFFDGKPRSASVRAVTDGELLSFSLDAFEIFSAKEPELSKKIVFDLSRILATRLRETTDMLTKFSI